MVYIIFMLMNCTLCTCILSFVSYAYKPWLVTTGILNYVIKIVVQIETCHRKMACSCNRQGLRFRSRTEI